MHIVFLSALLPALSHAGFLGAEIINGKKAGNSSLQYMASVQFNGKHKCGGFLVSPCFVLTAAHCDYGNLSVVLGTHNIKQNQKGIQKRKVVQKFKYNFKNVLKGNDIMLLQLSKPTEPSKTIQIAKIPRKDMPLKTKTKCHIAGWGYSKSNGQAVNDLLVTEVTTIDHKTCKTTWNSTKIKLPPNIICAGGYETKNGACQGDSGGPLVCNGIAVGIVSFNRNGNCNYPDFPNIYTQISKFLPWIRKIIKGI